MLLRNASFWASLLSTLSCVPLVVTEPRHQDPALNPPWELWLVLAWRSAVLKTWLPFRQTLLAGREVVVVAACRNTFWPLHFLLFTSSTIIKRLSLAIWLFNFVQLLVWRKIQGFLWYFVSKHLILIFSASFYEKNIIKSLLLKLLICLFKILNKINHWLRKKALRKMLLNKWKSDMATLSKLLYNFSYNNGRRYGGHAGNPF